MTTLAKCKKCLTTMTPMENELIICKCGEVTLDGIKRAVVCATDVLNYCEIDDNDNEIKLKDFNVKLSEDTKKPSYSELRGILDNMINTYEGMPPQAMMAPVNNYELASLLLLLRSLFASLESETSLIKESIEDAT